MSERFYLWGAGNIGRRALSYLVPLGIIEGIIDSSPTKRGQEILGLEVTDYGSVNPSGVIIAHFEPKATETILAGGGVRHWRLADFIPMWFRAERQQNAVGFLDVPITTRCSLNCRDCMQYIPYRMQQDIPLETLKRDLDAMFQSVAFVGEISIIGGEPFLHRQLPELLEYIGKCCRKQIGSLVITTNGTVIPETRTLELCAKLGVFISVSDYSKTLPWVEDSIAKLETAARKAGAEIERKRWSWMSPGRFDVISDGADCDMAHMQLRDGRIWRCTLMAAGEAAGFCSAKRGNDYIDLIKYEKGELRDFLSINTSREKTTRCKKCLKPMGVRIPSAVQI